MRVPFKRALVVSIALTVLVTGCNFNADRGGAGGAQNQPGNFGLRNFNQAMAEEAVIPLQQHQGNAYVSVPELVRLLEFQSDWDEEQQALNIGDIDVIYTLTPGSNQAVKEEQPFILSDPPVMIDNTMYITASSAVDLFQEDMNFELRHDALVLRGFPQTIVEEDMAGEMDFEDDELAVEDGGEEWMEPEAGEEGAGEEGAGEEDAGEEGAGEAGLTIEQQNLTVQSINRDRLIATARRFLGVKYQFGAKPYAQSKRFDCSSYVQHVFRQHGVTLPRTARTQATRGKAVSRKNLRKGDLVFFSVPGRFKSNKTPGHVGIYIGNGRMIHAINKPKNGVQTVTIKSGHWNRVYLRARRIS